MRDFEVPMPKFATITASLLFALYLFFLVWLLFISVGGTVRDEYFDKRVVHWVPLKNTWRALSIIFSGNFGAESRAGFTYLAFRNIFGNILLFIPFGFLAPLVFTKTRTLKSIILLTGSFSLLAELTQFVLKIGVFDIDDVIFNLIGGILGYIFLIRFRHVLFPEKM